VVCCKFGFVISSAVSSVYIYFCAVGSTSLWNTETLAWTLSIHKIPSMDFLTLIKILSLLIFNVNLVDAVMHF